MRPRDQVFSIDTPLRPSADRCTSAMCSRLLTPDLIARFQRMRGKAVFYPMGWDDNGSRRPSAACRTTTASAAIRRCHTIRRSCRAATPPKPPVSVSRPNFVELCARLTAEDEKAFEHLWRHLGLSVDWSMTYATIDRAIATRIAAGVPASAGPWAGVSGRGADALGRGFQDCRCAGRARGPRNIRRLSPHSGSASGGPRRSTSRRRGPS